MKKELVNNNNVIDDRFSFANDNVVLHDQKLETKPRGYFKDALIRFTKNKASIVASIIIGLIVLFALITPLATPNNVKTLMDPYYAKKGPRNTSLYALGFDGGSNITLTDRTLVFEAAKGVAAEFDENQTHPISIGESLDSYYQPVISIGNPYKAIAGRNDKFNYDSRVDQYLSVGFKFIHIEQKDFNKIKQFEEEKGIKILYPLIANNEYTYDTQSADAANYWYKTVGKCDPIKLVDGNAIVQSYSEELILEENYARNEDGSYKYFEYSGGGSVETAQYKVRVLYYTYYQYMYGREPNYLFGTDTSGYSMIYRLATGVRLSLLVAILVSVINFIIGAIYGAIEGYYGGAVDMVMERVSDILNDVPFIVVVTLFQLHFAAKAGSFVCLLFAYVLTGWIGTAASVRTQFYRYKNQEYVLAARTLGASNRRIMWKHIFPNTLGTLITSSVLVIPSVIFSESMLSYLGIVKLGGATTTSLGTLLSDASSIWTSYPSLMIFPALIISLLMICFNLFGNGLRDAFNPQLRGSDE